MDSSLPNRLRRRLWISPKVKEKRNREEVCLFPFTIVDGKVFGKKRAGAHTKLGEGEKG